MAMHMNIIESFFENRSLVNHHIQSFNEFLDVTLLQILNEYESSVTKDSISFLRFDNFVIID